MGRRRRARYGDNWLTTQIGGAPVWVAIVGAVVGVGLLAFGLTAQSQRLEAAGSWTPPPKASATPTPTPTPRTSIAFLGDSWAGGAGSEKAGAENSYAGKAGRQLGWNYSIFPGGGTGYTIGNTATGDGPFSTRVQGVIDFAPDIVVVQGSSNDYRADEEDIQAAAGAVFASLRSALPNAKIYALGVINSPEAPDDLNDVSRAAVSAAASANGVTFIDGNAEGWLNQSTDFADGYHPNEQGHQKVADRLVTLLRP